MKKSFFFILTFLCFQTSKITAQTITFSFANATTTTNGPNGSFEADVVLSTTTDFKMGSGQLYFNYNTVAFGNNVFANNKVNFSAPDDTYILGEKAFGSLNIYASFITNDNTTSRVSFAWQQDFGDICIAANNVTGTPTKLFHIQFDYTASGVNEPHNICFESNSPFDNQTFSSCELMGGSCGTCNSGSTIGEQYTNDVFDCAALILPIELVDFNAAPRTDFIQIDWASEREINFDNYELERSIDGKNFEFLTEITGDGGDYFQTYQFDDFEVRKGQLYYYRLKMNDLDGSIAYSEIKTAGLANELNVHVFPNPTRDVLTIDADELEIETIIIQNVSGQIVRKILTTIPSQKIETQFLPDGIYFLKIFGQNGQVITKEFVKLSH